MRPIDAGHRSASIATHRHVYAALILVLAAWLAFAAIYMIARAL